MKTILGLHQQLSRYDAALTAWGGSLMSLALRWYVGWQFFKAGLVKVGDWSATLALFHDEYMVPLLPPDLAAYFGAAGELALPLLLWVGLVSRPAALALFLVNAMAVISYPQLLSFECPAAINDHFYWGAMLLALVAFGPGKFSLDAWLAGRRAA
ncbi:MULTISPECIES: DoxX family protein [unclassified Duganella]|uniref:DoxX family protein n=1 Tax=unclassified Duganella TaxID=2636909 RepID=UPI000E354A5B|nr:MULTISPECIES: DoxX family protein [unclassified Duganella]RFP08569.1 DoxX family protein [Duganella sp. BJB475]RFP27577.1 DoxX family protein [Duganella sp. BJB476]